MNNLKKFALAAAISAMSLPMLLSAQTFEDHTKIRQLIGKPPTAATDMPSCPSGSTLSGGQCVLISNQATAMCPVGQVLRGIQAGTPVCVATSSGGGGGACGQYQWVYRDIGDSYQAFWEWVSYPC